MERRALILGLAILIVASGVAGAQARGEPLLRVSIEDDNIEPGSSTTLTLTMVNEGNLDWASTTNPSLTQQVTTARAISVQVDAEDAPFSVDTEEQLIGSLQEGGSTQVPFRIHVDEQAKPGKYEVPVEIEYAYTRYVSRDGITFQEEARIERTVTVTVDRIPQFKVVATNESLRSGETGRVSVTFENFGTAPARNSSVTLIAEGGGLGFGEEGVRQTTRYTGHWAPGERQSLDFRVHSTEAETSQAFSIDVQVEYKDQDGEQRTTEPMNLGISASASPTFSFEDVSASLRVDDRGVVTGSVVNTGSSPVRNAVVQLGSLPDGLTPRSAAKPVGDLGPGEEATFRFEVDVANRLAPGTYQLTLLPRFHGQMTESLVGDSHPFQVRIEPEREPFELSVLNGTPTPDADNYHLSIEVTNTGEVLREDIILTLLTGPPFTSETPTALVEALAPGETARVVFDLSVDEDAVSGSYPMMVNTTSDTAERDDAVDGPYLLKISVVEPTEGPANLEIIALAALLVVVVLGAGWWWLRN